VVPPRRGEGIACFGLPVRYPFVALTDNDTKASSTTLLPAVDHLLMRALGSVTDLPPEKLAVLRQFPRLFFN
jgi:hypothetical protein